MGKYVIKGIMLYWFVDRGYFHQWSIWICCIVFIACSPAFMYYAVWFIFLQFISLFYVILYFVLAFKPVRRKYTYIKLLNIPFTRYKLVLQGGNYNCYGYDEKDVAHAYCHEIMYFLSCEKGHFVIFTSKIWLKYFEKGMTVKDSNAFNYNINRACYKLYGYHTKSLPGMVRCYMVKGVLENNIPE